MANALHQTESLDGGPKWIHSIVHKDIKWTGALTGSTLWQPTSGKRFVVTDFWIVCSGAVEVTIFDGSDANGNRLVGGSFAANGGISAPNLRTPFRSSAIDNILKITVDAGSGYVTVLGYEE